MDLKKKMGSTSWRHWIRHSTSLLTDMLQLCGESSVKSKICFVFINDVSVQKLLLKLARVLTEKDENIRPINCPTVPQKLLQMGGVYVLNGVLQVVEGADHSP